MILLESSAIGIAPNLESLENVKDGI